jgi:transposase
MKWTPTHLTLEQMEERRQRGGQLLKAGKLSKAEIARQLGVSRAAVSQWGKRQANGGARALRRRKPKGRQPKLTAEQQRTLLKHLRQGAQAAGFPTARWTMGRVQRLIREKFGVRYHVHYMPRLLDKLNWSLQQPLARAQEQEADLIRAWLAQDWPRIKKSAAARRKHRVF